jgi:hypothetical protein
MNDWLKRQINSGLGLCTTRKPRQDSYINWLIIQWKRFKWSFIFRYITSRFAALAAAVQVLGSGEFVCLHLSRILVGLV